MDLILLNEKFNIFEEFVWLTELTGKRALVTGSKSGIGFAIAKRLVQAGAEIILHARNDSSEVEAAKI